MVMVLARLGTIRGVGREELISYGKIWSRKKFSLRRLWNI